MTNPNSLRNCVGNRQGLVISDFNWVCIGWLEREKVEDRSLFKGNTLGAVLVDKIGGRAGVWGILEFETLKGLMDVDETTGEEKL